ncbi:MAG: hypothetical protein RL398_3618 [Planctomycetota bacterium]
MRHERGYAVRMRRTIFTLASIVLPLMAAPAAAQQPAERIAAPSAKECAARRGALAAAVAKAYPGEAAVVVVRTAPKPDHMGTFVPDQDFVYLSGVAEPDTALLMAIDASGKVVADELLVPPFSRFAAVWEGTFLAPGEAAAKQTGFAVAGNVRALGERLAALCAERDGKRPILIAAKHPAAPLGGTTSSAADAARALGQDPFDGRSDRQTAALAKFAAALPGIRIEALEAVLHPLRTIKSPSELALVRASTEAAAEAIGEAMRAVKPGLYEYHLAAVARFVLSARGCGTDAYAAIVGAGPNGCVLHYSANARQIAKGDLIVMDYAATLHGYASDVTRTFPASGKFSEAQRKLVTDVYEIQQALIQEVKPGASLSSLSRRCAELLVARGYRSDHGPSHHVGLAVHDPSVDVLQPGMVITVEPGAYLRDVGMGCRIEDVVLVTEKGHEVLSKDVPSHPDAVEAWMRKKSPLGALLGGR